MSAIDTLKYFGCTAWFSLYDTIKNKIDNSGATTFGSITKYHVANNSRAGYFNGSAYITQHSNILSSDNYTLLSSDGYTIKSNETDSILLEQTFTLSIWFMQTASATSGVVNTIFDTSNSAVSVYTRLYINSSNSLIFSCKNSTSTITVTNPTIINNNVWYNVTITHTTSGIVMYVNGTSVATGGAITLDIVNQTFSTIGAYAYAKTNKFTGCLNNLVVFNTALSSEQVRKLYTLTYIK